MPESASEIYRRSADALRMPPVEDWSSFPFDGDMRPRALQPPEDEPALEGEGGVDCRACTRPDDEFLWTDERWRLSAFEPSGLPVVVILEPREHYAAPGGLPDDLARECGACTCAAGARAPSTCTGGSWGAPRACDAAHEQFRRHLGRRAAAHARGRLARQPRARGRAPPLRPAVASGAAMPATVIDGKAVAARVRAEVGEGVAEFTAEQGRPPGLATILVGEDQGSAIYVANKQKATAEVGMRGFDHRLGADATREQVVDLIQQLNADQAVSGILCQLPVPDHLDGVELTGLIQADKDVDGLTPVSAGLLALGREGLRPCTPTGVMLLLADAGAQLEGAEAVIVGRSNLFGKPMAQLLLGANATVTICHSRTRDLPGVCRRADVLIAAVGRDRLVRGDWIKPGATVIDVGINRSDDGLHGDVDFEAAVEVAGAITPVPGGVGPMTIACLLRNTLQAAHMAVA